MNFIQQIVEYTLQHHSISSLKDHLYIFPSKRAVAQFNQLLIKNITEQSFFLPETKTIQEFVIEKSNLTIADELLLLQELYLIHGKITQQEQTFQQFASWGKLMLKDFDEIDKYNVDTNYFFNVLQAHKEVDEHYEMKELANEYLKIFYQNTNNEKQGIFYDDFVKTWQFLGDTYKAFQSFLQSNNLAYEGMAYRKLLKEIEQQETQLEYSNIVFCGFNAFTFTEEKILDAILAQYKNVETWWDIDDLFMHNKFHEAGNFLRKYKSKYSTKNHHWCNDKATHQQIKIVAVPSNVGQIHFVKNNIQIAENNAIVLCDETLLEQCKPIFDSDLVNITMGSAVQKSNVYSIVEKYLQCIQNAKIEDADIYYYTSYIVEFFSHQEMKPYLIDENIFQTISFYKFPINADKISSYINDEEILKLFKTNNSAQIINNCIHLLQKIEFSNTNDNLVKQKIINTFLEYQKKINYNIINTTKDILLIIQNYILNTSIPFNTNRANTTQIMGFLETRLQDFDNLYILSLNDKILPGTNKSNSFIPYHLRKSFHLPTFDQFDGVNAYHFYRLLKRAKNIYLLYNSASNSDSDNEKSRFIKQIEYELDKNKSTITTHSTTMQHTISNKNNQKISIAKNQTMIDELYKMSFSPSCINVYLVCPIQFYLKYILKVYIPDELNTNKETADFGTILHKIMEIYYSKNTKANLPNQSEMEQYINDAIRELGHDAGYFSGANALNKKIVEKLFLDILMIDTKEDFDILGLEKELFTTISIKGKEVIIKGKIDRVDSQNGNIRILDYKTGKVELCDFPSLENEKSINDFFDKIFNKKSSSYKETFQGLMYAWIYQKCYPKANIVVGYYTAKKLQNGIQYLNNGQSISTEILQLFEEKLIELLEEILDIQTPFNISEDENAYQYTIPYKELLLI